MLIDQFEFDKKGFWRDFISFCKSNMAAIVVDPKSFSVGLGSTNPIFLPKLWSAICMKAKYNYMGQIVS